MNSVATYHFYQTKYHEELLIDVVELKKIKKYLTNNPFHKLTYYDITLITDGKGVFRIDDKEYLVKKNDIIFSLPNQIRRWEAKDIINGYALIFESDFLLSFFSDSNFINNISYLNNIKSRDYKLTLNDDEFVQFLSLIGEIKKEIHSSSRLDTHILRALLYQAIKYLDRIYLLHNGNDTTKQCSQYVHNFSTLVNLQYIEFHTVKYYADKLNITPNYLNEIVKKETGFTPKQIIQNKLLLESKKLLLYTDNSIKQITDILNFETPSYFIRFFQKHLQITPLEFRNKKKP